MSFLADPVESNGMANVRTLQEIAKDTIVCNIHRVESLSCLPEHIVCELFMVRFTKDNFFSD